MHEEARVSSIVGLAPGATLHASPHSHTRLASAGELNDGDDAWVVLSSTHGNLHVLGPPPRGARAPSAVLAYRALERPAPMPAPRAVDVDLHRVHGNDFRPLFESARAAGALISVAASRSVNVGPESERTWVVLSGTGLVFLENDTTTLRIKTGDVAVVPPGEPARLWSRGPEDLRVVALQPQAPPAPRRSLLSEVQRLREKERSVSGAGF